MIASKPSAIVSLSPTATEMLFAIGAGAQVKAVDDQSNYPPQAPKTKLSGFQPNVEAIASYQPDLVVISGDVPGLSSSLTKLSIPVLVEPAAKTLDDTYAQIMQLGQATGNVKNADDLVASMKSRINAIVASLPKFASPPTYYHELDNTYFTATSKTFIGSVYGLLGLKNIADPADKKASGYPQLSAEYIIQANPQIIFLADTKCCGQSAETVAKRPGWNQIAAVRDGHVIALDDDVASRWGPRIVDFLQTVANALKELKQAA
ncbi:MAG TPA: ABC transporter substrate-binding protein [Actinomycetota bacterium]|nr:ABC transporter substrate-binding protein [Actinomycetota bacterium]